MLTKAKLRLPCAASMNIWLRERERANGAHKRRGPVKAALSVSRQGGGGGGSDFAQHGNLASPLDVSDGGDCSDSGSVVVQLKLRFQPPPPKLNGIAPCKGCGDSVGPIGLCLCRDQYEM